MSPENDTPPLPPAPPEPPVLPEAPIGSIIDPATQSSGLLKQPTADDLAKFAPPPPIAPPAAMPSVPANEPGAPAAQDIPRLAETTAAFGVTVGTIVQPPPIMPEPPPVVEVRPKAFHELNERTQTELKAGWARTHKGEPLPEDWVEPVRSSPSIKHDPNAPRSEPDHDAVVEVDKKSVKVSQRTLDEMEEGRARLAVRKAETDRIRAQQAEQNAQKLQSASVPADPSNMDYTEGR